MAFKDTVKSIFNSFGLEIRKRPPSRPCADINFPVELNESDREIILQVTERGLTMTSSERLCATMMACKHAIETGIEGDFVECGVWRGGNALLAAATFDLYNCDKGVYLFDTFAGMTLPTNEDKSITTGESAKPEFSKNQKETHNEWCYASIEDVKNNFSEAGLMSNKIRFIKGDVMKTLEDPENIPRSIAVLRLDTDWYDSTRKELEVLYPKLSRGGVLIIDDYGHWAGAKKATDEYFSKLRSRPFLQYVDYTGRMGIKPD